MRARKGACACVGVFMSVCVLEEVLCMCMYMWVSVSACGCVFINMCVLEEGMCE